MHHGRRGALVMSSAVHRRRAGSLRSCQRARASANGRAYLASEATGVWPLLAMSIGVDAPASASWVSALCRSWCRVAPPDAALNRSSGPAVSQEHQACLAAFQQPGGAGLPDDDVDRAALAAHLRLAVGQVQVLATSADLSGANLTDADLDGADLTGAKWPKDAPVPEGWKRGPGSGRLKRR
jgi:hypothetical protein